MESTHPVCSHMVPSTGSAPKPIATVASPKPRADSCTPGSEYRSPSPRPTAPSQITPGPRRSASNTPSSSAMTAKPSARRVI